MIHKLRIAVCQFPVSCDIAGNSKFIRRFMKKAAESEAHVIQFPETALSGYERTNSDNDILRQIEDNTEEIKSLAENLGLWVVLGSCRKIMNAEKPANCLHVISDKGKIVGTYDKQKLTPAEVDWYSSGKGFLVVTINGIKCGFLICYELCFPKLFETYRKKDVQLVFHSCHNVSRKPQTLFQEITSAQIRTRAIDNQMWIAGSNPSAKNSFSKTCIARPDGSVRSLKRHTNGILLYDFPDTKLGWTYNNRK